jgi:hypothetical protein
MFKYWVHNIKWDAQEKDKDLELPFDMEFESNYEYDEDEISDYITEEIGVPNKGFLYVASHDVKCGYGTASVVKMNLPIDEQELKEAEKMLQCKVDFDKEGIEENSEVKSWIASLNNGMYVKFAIISKTKADGTFFGEMTLRGADQSFYKTYILEDSCISGEYGFDEGFDDYTIYVYGKERN